MRIAYINGQYVPYHHAMVPMEDRGYQFADGCYEVCVFYNHRFLDWDLHLKRLHYSLDALQITLPMSDEALTLMLGELLRMNPYRDGYIYLQVTRGVARRNHLFPHDARAGITISVMPAKTMPASAYEKGVKVISAPDMRWARCDIKSIALLPNVLIRQQAAREQAVEAFMFNADDELTEGTLSTAFIVSGGAVHTHPESPAVLHGVRKQVVKQLCEANNIGYHERMIPRSDVLAADEAFITSANSHILPVSRIDDHVIGSGKAGPVSKRLLALYQAHVSAQTGKQWA